MPETRSQMEKTQSSGSAKEDNLVRDAGERAVSTVVGSPGSVRSTVSPSLPHEHAVLVAKLRSAQLKKELAQEACRLQEEQKEKILKAEHEVQVAELVASLSLKDDALSLQEPEEKVAAFLAQCSDRTNFPINTDEVTYEPNMVPTKHNTPTRTTSDLPKVDLLPFDGKPEVYWKFVRQFEIYIEPSTPDQGQRFLYLLHYCRGLAREAIEECVMLPLEESYPRAREILKNLFGQPHVVARSILDNLFKEFESACFSAEHLSRLVIKMKSAEIALTQMQYTAELNSLLVLERIVKCLPLQMQQQWAENAAHYVRMGRDPFFADLVAFMSARADVINSRFGQLVQQQRTSRRLIHGNVNGEPQAIKRQHSFAQITGETSRPEAPMTKCPVCAKNHSISECTEFLTLSAEDRWSRAKAARLCFVCLKGGHRSSDCRVRLRCDVDNCGARHHRLLHFVRKSSMSANCATAVCKPRSVSLGMLPVRINGPNGHLEAYAFLDNGSDTTVVCERVLDVLGIPKQANSTEIKTLGGGCYSEKVSRNFVVSSIDGFNEITIESALVVRDLMSGTVVDDRSEIAKHWPHLNNLIFQETRDKRIAILIGCDVPEAHWILSQRVEGRKQPYAIETLLGWVLLGPTQPRAHDNASVYLSSDSLGIANQLKHMYDSEFLDAGTIVKAMSLEDAMVIEVADKETEYVDGHYVVPLPWKKGLKAPNNNYSVALFRLNHLRTKLLREPSFFKKYAGAMQATIEKGYAKLVVNNTSDSDAIQWYLPHHAVFNPKKPSKIRVVFDCAAKFRNVSLNDMLCQGPDITTNLIKVLLKFRLGRVAVSADVEEMFMQIKVPLRDRSALRFLWWPTDDLNNKPSIYEMTVHPFGAKSSPYCANYALRRTAFDFGGDYDPSVSQAVLCNFYVDDCLASFDSIEIATNFVKECKSMLARGGFHLRKWVSNEPCVLDGILDADRATSPVAVTAHAEPLQRALGILWNATMDVFIFWFDIPDRALTRRGILSAVSSFYDPMGLLSPLCMPPKLVLQRLCKLGLGWDQPIEKSEADEWKSWLDFVKSLGEIQIPRRLDRNTSVLKEQVELHIFADASESGYGVVAYANFVSQETESHCTLIFAKSRVAPLKSVTIPRLELTAAVLAVKVSEILKSALPDYFKSTHFWTDSMIVLHYINDTESRFATFVANRLSVIHQYSTVDQWRHVKSGDNPADMASRGIKSSRDLQRWLDGPNLAKLFISARSECWAVPKEKLEHKRVNVLMESLPIQGTTMRSVLLYYSDWYKLLKGVAWLKRFVEYLRFKSELSSAPPRKGYHSVSELRDAKRCVLKLVQHESFTAELAQLTSNDGRGVGKGSHISRLDPIILDGLICVGGRLNYGSYPSSRRHPVILPSKHNVTELLIRHHHELEGHSGKAHVLATIRQKFWIIHGGAAVKRVVGRCVKCLRRTALSCKQIMSPLPLVRIESGARCFEAVGVDYFGPFTIKRGRSLEKRYGCLFTCLRSRAVHIEVAHSLSTDSFVMALMRFIGRRGRPLDIFSDNGTNFVGAIRELREHLQKWDQKRITDHLLHQEIQWHFNPPGASHRGGVWERIIRSIRNILYSLATQQTLTDETLLTFFGEAERILNGRPLVPPSTDCQDDDPLTPNHLLLMQPNPGITSECSFRERFILHWKQVNYLADIFWKRWVKEYVATLQVRQKWLHRSRNLKSGDIVLVSCEQTPRECWPLARVADVCVDQDDLVRTVTVRTSKGLIQRDVRKLCLLEGVD